jgi:hypothetical protein
LGYLADKLDLNKAKKKMDKQKINVLFFEYKSKTKAIT